MNAPIDYLLHLADNALILGQRNAEWCGHGPILEEDIALSNNSLDLVGQARMLYQHAAALHGGDATEDTLAYFRDVPDFKNYTLCELPHMPLMSATAQGDRDFAMTMTRNFLYSSLMVLVWDQLQNSKDAQLAAIAAKSLKEVRYHLRIRATGWCAWVMAPTSRTPKRKRRSTNCCPTPKSFGATARTKPPHWPTARASTWPLCKTTGTRS